ncbi:MAG: thioredoxin-disulfide reductase [Holosporales bacterium]|jgi:thioredoxin reductase (NADPH)|nr:thioredoxin-disulfide reductase [Holosporales bacterium]
MKTYISAIIGSGPAGLTAAIYLARAGLHSVIITGKEPGGQLVRTDVVENYPGFESISGADLMMSMLKQAENLGTELIYEDVINIENSFDIHLSSGNKIAAQSVVIATGAKHKRLGCVGEKEFENRGVSGCATCDGPRYRGETVAVVGGGNTAAMEASFLAKLAAKVLLIHRRDSLRADKISQKRIFDNPKIEVLWNSEIVEISGSRSVEEIKVKNNKDGSNNLFKVAGVFIAIGTAPASEFVRNFVNRDSEGYIIACNTKTSKTGVFAAGDIVSGSLKQAVFAAGQGALAAKCVEEFVN